MEPFLAMSAFWQASGHVARDFAQAFRGVVCGTLSLALLGCGSNAHDPVWQSVKAAATQLAEDPGPQVPLTAQQDAIRQAVAQQVPQMPLLMMTLPSRDAVATLGLMNDTHARQTWADASGITITFQSGIVVETRGLGHDRIASDVEPLLFARASGTSQPYTRRWRELDANGRLAERSSECTLYFQPEGQTEHCDGPPSFKNWYKGTTSLTSLQWLGPELGYLEIERLN